MLLIKNYQKNYVNNLVLEVENLEIPSGIHWFKGINGSGKSTFFKSVAGIIPFKGEILLENQYDIRKDAIDYRLRVNYGEAEPLYPDFLSGYEILKFIAETKKASENQIEELIGLLEVGSYIQHKIGSYSSGMLKKFSIILAFLGKPKLIMLDEPLITIDTKAVQNVCDLINRYHENGVNFFLSSHQDFRFEQLSIAKTYEVKNKTIIEITKNFVG